MFMFLYNQEFSLEAKRINYNYYEPRCIHESSLSPSIHSIFAIELGEKKQAYDFFKFSTRLDLDNYNRNTAEGLHLTSIAAAWMNIVYGFGGMRSDGDIPAFNPSLPEQWSGFSFKLIYNDSVLRVKIDSKSAEFKILKGNSQNVRIYNKEYKIDEKGIAVKITK
jgi:maltose phosphorylase